MKKKIEKGEDYRNLSQHCWLFLTEANYVDIYKKAIFTVHSKNSSALKKFECTGIPIFKLRVMLTDALRVMVKETKKIKF